ncbi:thiamine pyrophosphokinase 1 [Cornus florida]|uniref:thiamine pyrophosphokinase 1 n=1 Tax=Cornus florida TaxID=4283 RepID=UPI00289BFAC4|nr:thiamine pyrophosphokinase 1 [Cornus florida]
MTKSENFIHNLFKPFNFVSKKDGQKEDLERIAAQEQKLFPFETLVAAKNFHPNHKLGQGGFGHVYKVISKFGFVQHRNVVNLLGYCMHGAEKLLVYGRDGEQGRNNQRKLRPRMPSEKKTGGFETETDRGENEGYFSIFAARGPVNKQKGLIRTYFLVEGWLTTKRGLNAEYRYYRGYRHTTLLNIKTCVFQSQDFKRRTRSFFLNLLAMPLMTHSSTFLLPPTPADNLPSPTYVLVLLNQRLPRFAPLLWDHAKLRICADGGANRLFDEFPQLFPQEDASVVQNRYKPDVIKGDMDSVRQEVKDFYKNMNTEIEDASNDQDTTDLHKCIAYIRDCTPNLDKSNLCILVAGALGGRFDHEAGNINVLYNFSSMRIVLLSNDCLIQLLPKTHRHEIHIQSSVEGPHCGLVPIGMPSRSTTTSGLEWNLAGTEMRFGGLISTSNIVKEKKITVQSDSDLLWTISIH